MSAAALLAHQQSLRLGFFTRDLRSDGPLGTLGGAAPVASQQGPPLWVNNGGIVVLNSLIARSFPPRLPSASRHVGLGCVRQRIGGRAAQIIEGVERMVLRRRGVRGKSQVAVYTPEDLPMPVAGADVGAALVQMLEARGIEFHPEQIVMKVEPASHTVRYELKDTKFDLLVDVPAHRVPAVVRQAKLADASGWVPVEPSTPQTRHPGVYAIGDVTSIRLPIGMYLPKVGVFANEEAPVVAENIAAEVEGKSPSSRFNGHGFCYIEVGDDMAAYGAGNFYGIPAARVTLEPPSPRYRVEKHEIERTAQSLWL